MMMRKGTERGRSYVDVLLNQNLWAHRLPDDLAVEIIKRLQIKDVIRCKSVSKSWFSIIQQPEFAQAYRDFNPFCLVVSIHLFSKGNYFECLYYSQANSGRETKLFPLYKDENLRRLHKREGGATPMATRVLNGVICHCSDRYVLVCNVFTGEIMRLPDPPQHPPKSSCTSLKYYLGYDPVRRVYKLLYRRNFLDNGYRPKCFQQSHILTLGNNSSWKEIVVSKGKRFCSFESLTICSNGVLYWIEKVTESDALPTGYCLTFLNLCDSEEKIGNCSIPIDISNDTDRWIHYDLVQFRGRPSLISCMGTQVTFHTLEDCAGKQGNWTRHDLILPSELDIGSIVWTDNLPTGEVLLGTIGCRVLSYHFENGKTLIRLLFKGFRNNNVFFGKPNIATLDTLINNWHL